MSSPSAERSCRRNRSAASAAADDRSVMSHKLAGESRELLWPLSELQRTGSQRNNDFTQKNEQKSEASQFCSCTCEMCAVEPRKLGAQLIAPGILKHRITGKKTLRPAGLGIAGPAESEA